MSLKISIIITTYNSEEWLIKVLQGFLFQTEKNFEIIIADDGSSIKTKQVIDSFSLKFKNPIIHVWQEDNGFQKTKILNKAITKSKSDYLLFTDGDCIPRKDFVETHLKFKEKGYFLSGGYYKLSQITSNSVENFDIENGNCFSIIWLLKNGIKVNFKLSKLTKNKILAKFMNWITPTKKTFNGHNSSCYKKDIIAVNGFNEAMFYGGLDREFGERLFNLGIKSKQIRYSAICLHLEHDRKYATKQHWENNFKIRNFNKKNKITFIENGINKYLKNED